jgi:uncharacterized membrane protein
MTLNPILSAPPIIQAHILAALIVAACTPFQLWGFRKGSRLHRVIGYVWLCAMLCVVLTSFFITSHFRWNIAGFSVIHGLSAISLVSIIVIIRAARQGAIRTHQSFVYGLTAGFWIAGAFTLTPVRILGSAIWQ